MCAELWMPEHPETFIALQKEFIAAGSGAILTPTGGANAQRLRGTPYEGRVWELNELLCDISKEALSEGVLLGGSLSFSGFSNDPSEQPEFRHLAELYREQAVVLKASGVDFLYAESIMSLSQARAVTLAGRSTGLPVLVAVWLDSDGYLPSGTSFLSCLVTLEALGAAAVGINCTEDTAMIAEILREAVAVSEIPLIAKPGVSEQTDADSFAESMRPLLKSGAGIVGGCCGAAPEHIAALKKILWEYTPTEPGGAGDYTALASENGVWFLQDILLSDPIECGFSLADILIDREDEEANVLRIRLTGLEDVERFIENIHMSNMPIALHAEDLETLEMALLCYPGRAIVDISSPVDETRLRITAAKYGAVVY